MTRKVVQPNSIHNFFIQIESFNFLFQLRFSDGCHDKGRVTAAMRGGHSYRCSPSGVPVELSLHSKRAIDANAFEMFVKEDNSRVQVRCCRKVADILERTPATATARAHEKLGDTCEAVVRVFAKHGDSSAVLSAAARAVAALASASPKVRAKLVKERALSAIVAAMRAHGAKRSDLATNACLAIAAMLDGGTGSRSTGGGWYGPIAFARSRPKPPFVARTGRGRRPYNGARSERWTQLESGDVYGGVGPQATAALRRALQIGAPAAISAAMRAHPLDRYVQAAALQALGAMVEMTAAVEAAQRHNLAGAIDPPLGWKRLPVALASSVAITPAERLALRAAERVKNLGEALGMDASVTAALSASTAPPPPMGESGAGEGKRAGPAALNVGGEEPSKSDETGRASSEATKDEAAPPPLTLPPHLAVKRKLSTLLLLGGKGFKAQRRDAVSESAAHSSERASGEIVGQVWPSALGAMEAERVDSEELLLELGRAGAVRHAVAVLTSVSPVMRDGAVQIGCCRFIAALWSCSTLSPPRMLRAIMLPERSLRAVRFAFSDVTRRLDDDAKVKVVEEESSVSGGGRYTVDANACDSVGLIGDLELASCGAPASAGSLPMGQVDECVLRDAVREAFDRARTVATERRRARLGRRRAAAVRVVVDIDGGTDRLLMRATLLDAFDIARRRDAAEGGAIVCALAASTEAEAHAAEAEHDVELAIAAAAKAAKGGAGEEEEDEEEEEKQIEIVWGANSLEELPEEEAEPPPGMTRRHKAHAKRPPNPYAHNSISMAHDDWGHVATQGATMKWCSIVSSPFESSRVVYMRVHSSSPRIFVGVADASWDVNASNAEGGALDELPWEASLVAGYTGFGNMCSCGAIVLKGKAKLAATAETEYYGVAVELWVNMYTRSIDVLVEGEWQGSLNLDAGTSVIRLVATLYEEHQRIRIEGWEEWTTPEEYALAAGIVTEDQLGRDGLGMAYLEAREARQKLARARSVAWSAERLQRRRKRRATQSRNRYHCIIRNPIAIAARPAGAPLGVREGRPPGSRPAAVAKRASTQRRTAGTTTRYELRTDVDEYFVRITLRKGGGTVSMPRGGFTAANKATTAELAGHIKLWPLRPDRMAHGEIVFDGVVSVHATTPQAALQLVCAPHALVLRPSYIPPRLANDARAIFRKGELDTLHGTGAPDHEPSPLWNGLTRVSSVPPRRSLIVDVPSASPSAIVLNAAWMAQENGSHRLQPFIEEIVSSHSLDEIDPPFVFPVGSSHLLDDEDLFDHIAVEDHADLHPPSVEIPARLGFADDEDTAELLGEEATETAESGLEKHIADAKDRVVLALSEVGFEPLGLLRVAVADSEEAYRVADKAVEDHFEAEAEWLIKTEIAAKAAREAKLPGARKAAAAKAALEEEERAQRAESGGADSEEEEAQHPSELAERAPSPDVDMAAIAKQLEADLTAARVVRGKARAALVEAEEKWAKCAVDDAATEESWRVELKRCQDHQAMLRRFHIDEVLVAPNLHSINDAEETAKLATNAAKAKLDEAMPGVRERRLKEIEAIGDGGAERLGSLRLGVAAAEDAVMREEAKVPRKNVVDDDGGEWKEDEGKCEEEEEEEEDEKVEAKLNETGGGVDDDACALSESSMKVSAADEAKNESDPLPASVPGPKLAAAASVELRQARASLAFAREKLRDAEAMWAEVYARDEEAIAELQGELAIAEEWQDRLALCAAVRGMEEGDRRLGMAKRDCAAAASLVDGLLEEAWTERRVNEALCAAEGALLCFVAAECAIVCGEARTLLLPPRCGSRIPSFHNVGAEDHDRAWHGPAARATALGFPFVAKTVATMKWRVDTVAMKKADHDRKHALHVARVKAEEEETARLELEARLKSEKARGVRRAKGGDEEFPPIKARDIATARAELTEAYTKLDLPDHLDALDELMQSWKKSGGFVDKLIASEIKRATKLAKKLHRTKKEIELQELAAKRKAEEEAIVKEKRKRLAAKAWKKETELQAAVHLQQSWKSKRAAQLQRRAERSRELDHHGPHDLVELLKGKIATGTERRAQIELDIVWMDTKVADAEVESEAPPPRPRSRLALRPRSAPNPEKEVKLKLAARDRTLRRSNHALEQLRAERAALARIAEEQAAMCERLHEYEARLGPQRCALLVHREMAERKWHSRLAAIEHGGYHQRLAEAARWQERVKSTLARQDWRAVLENRIVAEREYAILLGVTADVVGHARAAAAHADRLADAAHVAYLAEFNRPRLRAECAAAVGVHVLRTAIARAVPRVFEGYQARTWAAVCSAVAAASEGARSAQLGASSAEREHEMVLAMQREIEELKLFGEDEVEVWAAKQRESRSAKGKRRTKKKTKKKSASRAGMAASPDLNRMLLSAIDPDALLLERPPSGSGISAARHLTNSPRNNAETT